MAEPVILPQHWAAAPSAPAPAPRAGWLRTAYAVTEVMFRRPDGPPPAQRLRWLCAELDDMDSKVRGKGFAVLKLSFWLVNWVAPLMVFSLPTFRRLSFERRCHALERFERSPFGMALFALKAMTCMIYFEHPDALATMQFTGGSLTNTPSAASTDLTDTDMIHTDPTTPEPTSAPADTGNAAADPTGVS